jgi:uncharacterized membrane protein YeaQ/YmgE (transglycosylase-associated protein family)
MGLIITILAGAFIGWIASMIMGTNASMGALANIIAGLVGAFVGGFIANLLGFGAQGAGFSISQLLFGILGACIVIGIYKAISGGGRTVTR